MKLAKEFQVWIIEDALPKLRKYGFYEVDNKTKTKIKELNHKIALLTKSNNKLKNNMTKINIHMVYIFMFSKMMECIK